MANEVKITGNIVADPIISFLPGSGLTVVKFALAHNYINKSGDKFVSYFDIESFGETAEQIGDNCGKGTFVTLRGFLKQNRWKDKDSGANRSRVVINCTGIEIFNKEFD